MICVGIQLAPIRESRSVDWEGKGCISMHLIPIIRIALHSSGPSQALSHKASIGWVIGGIGAAGMAAVFTHSIILRRERSPSFDGFLLCAPGRFAARWIGTLAHSLFPVLPRGIAVPLAGCGLGISAGRVAESLEPVGQSELEVRKKGADRNK